MTDVDWFVIIAALGVASAGVSWYGYRRWRRLVLSPADLEFAVVDPLSAKEFTRYCAALVRLLGYQRVRRARGGAVSLTATAPDGTLVAIRCARQKEPVAADAVRALREGITAGGHAGRTGILVTNALVAPQARALASDTGITLADRAVLRHWMELARAGGLGGTVAGDAASAGAGVRAAVGPRAGGEARASTGVRAGSEARSGGGARAGAGTRTRIGAPVRAVDTLVAGSMVGCAALVLIAVGIHAATGTAGPRVAGPRAAASGAAVPGAAAAGVAAVSSPAAITPSGIASTGGPASTGDPASTTGMASGGGGASRERHVLHVQHVKHIEHMRHVEYIENHAPSQ